MNNAIVAEVGAGGEVVIDPAIRERLGVQPGYRAVQILSGEHVEIHFVPPRHSRSLLGAAKPFMRSLPIPEEQWDNAVAQAIAEEFQASNASAGE